MLTLKYIIGQDQRKLTPFELHEGDMFDLSKDPDVNKNKVQAMQYNSGMDEIFLELYEDQKDSTGALIPFDLSGANIMFEGWKPDGTYIVDSDIMTPISLQQGQCRINLPDQAFAVYGSYKQAFFRIYRDNKNIATLEFTFNIRADMVQGQIKSVDWIGPVHEILEKAKEDYESHKKSLDDAVSNAIAEYTKEMNTLKALGVSVDTSLSALLQKIKDNNLFTQAEADAFKQAIVDQMAKLFEQAKAAVSDKQVATNMANFALAQGDNYTLSLPPYDRDSFTHATTVPHGESVVNVAFITDNHWQEDGNDIFDNSDGYAYHSLQHYQWFAEGTLLSKPDIVIADGDNVNGDDNRTSNIYTTRHVKAMLDASYIKSSVFMIPGNHDLGIGQFDGSKKPGMVMSNDDLKSTYGTKPCRFGEVRNGDSLYFYKDLPDKKVRIIGLNSSDGPMTTGADGNYIWDAINVHVFSAEQLSWLVEKALVLPDTSWQVAIFFHAPIGKAFGGWDKESTSTINSDCLLDILTAFKNGTSTTCNSANSLAPITGLAADFTEQGKGTIIGIFNGHFHKDMQDLSTLNGTPMIETDASLTSQLNQARYNTINEDCWETISIDTAKRTIHCYRFGRGQDREFNY